MPSEDLEDSFLRCVVSCGVVWQAHRLQSIAQSIMCVFYFSRAAQIERKKMGGSCEWSRASGEYYYYYYYYYYYDYYYYYYSRCRGVEVSYLLMQSHPQFVLLVCSWQRAAESVCKFPKVNSIQLDSVLDTYPVRVCWRRSAAVAMIDAGIRAIPCPKDCRCRISLGCNRRALKPNQPETNTNKQELSHTKPNRISICWPQATTKTRCVGGP